MNLLRFGVYELDRDARVLRRAGREVRLAPQPMTLLLALLERPGETVGRDELRRRIWGDATFVAFERSLNFCVNRLRRALQDDARRPRFVETLNGEGYRFVAPVSVAEPPSGLAPGPEPSRTAQGRRVALLAAAALLWLSGQDHAPSRDAIAEALYARARALCGTQGYRESVALFSAALDRQPAMAAAHAGLARSYLELGATGALDPGQAYPLARAAARRALAIEERVDARLVLGRVLLLHDWDWKGAEREIRRALEIAPESSEAFRLLARFESARGEHAAALMAARRAESLAPGSFEALEEAAFCHYRARLFDEAARRFRRLAERRPEEAHHRLFAIYRLAGRDSEAAREAAEVMRLAGVPEATIERVSSRGPERALALYLRGTLDYLQREAERQRVPPERRALVWAALGESAEAMLWLDRAAEERSPDLVTALQDPMLDGMRREPRFQDLLRRVGVSGA